jgi:hypothetical protein
MPPCWRILPIPQRAALTLRYLDGLPVAVVAARRANPAWHRDAPGALACSLASPVRRGTPPCLLTRSTQCDCPSCRWSLDRSLRGPTAAHAAAHATDSLSTRCHADAAFFLSVNRGRCEYSTYLFTFLVCARAHPSPYEAEIETYQEKDEMNY